MYMTSKRFINIVRSFLLASGVVAPWLLGIMTHNAAAGSIASFGTYLMIISFPFLPKRRAWLVLAISALVHSVFSAIGASVILGSLAFFLFAAIVAFIQGVSELRKSVLSLPVALAALAFFLSVGQAADGDEVFFLTYFFSGTVWGGIMTFALVATATEDTKAVNKPSWLSSQKPFLASMVGVSLIASIVATMVPSTHPCWLPAAALRVMKPTRQQTKKRIRDRALGSLLGACFGGLLLGLYTFPLLHVFFVLLLVFGMLMIGAKHYAIWTFCLTAVALTFNLHPGSSALLIATDRVLLTVGGLFITALALWVLPDEL